MEIANFFLRKKIANDRSLQLDNLDSDDEYENQSDDETEDGDDEFTILEDVREEVAALEAEADLPLEEILKAYSEKTTRLSRESIQVLSTDTHEPPFKKHKTNNGEMFSRFQFKVFDLNLNNFLIICD
ncbi:hypothetical protein FCM35_KLT16545 [Carex littledalei]|uniref:Uncharacterized protein n=1 Tax=Carex littledalei TaxID=544730 RepID=A0A833W088_9POAL|nr:hypothetical protein FCM35_KLT16545 [Carex littledalei]